MSSSHSSCTVVNSATGVITAQLCSTTTLSTCQFNCKVGPCPSTSPIAVADGTKCCKNYKSTCDGGPLTYTDPTSCCWGASLDCPHEYGCIDYPRKEEIGCSNSDLIRRGGNLGYLLSPSALTWAEAAQFCIDNKAGLATITTVEQAKEISLFLRDNNFGSSTKIWSSLMAPNIISTVSCSNGGCDSKSLTWGDGTKFSFDPAVLDSLDWTNTGQFEACSTYGPVDYNDYISPMQVGNCFTQTAYALCEGSCDADIKSDYCHDQYPYPLASGATCCNTFLKKDHNPGIGCDGTLVQYDDPSECCSGSTKPCASLSGTCLAHPKSRREY